MTESAGRSEHTGIYDLGDGTVHIVIEEMCAHFGVPANAENVAIAMAGLNDALAELYPDGAPPVVVFPG